MSELISTAAFVSVMAAAMVADVRTNRIPNTLVVVGLCLGLASRAVLGWAALASGVIAAASALALGVGLFAVGAMGAGDGKLMAVVGAFLGIELGATALLAAAMLGGVLALGMAVRRGVILPVLVGTRELALWLVTFGRKGERVKLDSPGAVSFPFGVAIALGSLLTWFGVFRV